MTKIELEIQIEDWKQGLISDIDLKAAVDAYSSASNGAKPDVSGWLEFEKQKPNEDKLILVTNGGYVEICYYKNGDFKKAWAFDEDDKPVFKARVKGHPRWAELYWRYIELPTIH